MKIAVISDIHDHDEHLQWFFTEISKREISYVFGLGDYCSADIIQKLTATPLPIFAVWGNNDHDKQSMCLTTQSHHHFILTDDTFGEITLNEKRYFLSHYPEPAENAARSHDFDAVFYGHLHHARHEKIGSVPIINPGKFATYPNNIVSFAIFDTVSEKTEMIIKP
jgi:putative phosphoesterase